VKPYILIISPALANANNGNWQTAHRWAGILGRRYRVTVAASHDDAVQSDRPDLLIALHARRSAQALVAFVQSYPALPTILALTGTDLYRDIRDNASAQHSLKIATRLVVLQDAGLQELDRALQVKTHVIYQSAPALKPVPLAEKFSKRYFDVCMIGHLREEKDPATFMHAAQQITLPHIRFIHIGGTLDQTLAEQARHTQQSCHPYRWLGDVPHAEARQRLKRSHLMAIASRMEGGANVIIEAITSGVPVIASDIAGNRGMLGMDYAGYFPQGDSGALARLIERAASDPDFYLHLHRQCQARTPLFTPGRERTALLNLVDNTLHQNR
jgi:putative glycosyltransferase (TIGR04348 family)